MAPRRRGERERERAMQTIGVKRRYRTIFLSDIHLGTRGCRADFLLDFLRRTECERLYLVGDVVDGWRLRKSWYWTETFDDVLRHILGMARRGTEVVYIPGNHDEMFRAWLGLEIAGVRLRARGGAPHRRRAPPAGDPRRRVRRRDPLRQVPRAARRLGLRLGADDEPLVQRGAAAPRLSLLVALAVAEAAGEGRGEGDRPLRDRAGDGSRAPRPGRRGVRPHPPRRDARGAAACST